MEYLIRAGFQKVDGWYVYNYRPGRPKKNKDTLRVRECDCNELEYFHYVCEGKGFDYVCGLIKLATFIDNPQYRNLERHLAKRMFTHDYTRACAHPFILRNGYKCNIPNIEITAILEYNFGTNRAKMTGLGPGNETITDYLRTHPRGGFAIDLTEKFYQAEKRQRAADEKIEQLTAALNSAIDQINELREALAYAPGGPIAQAAAESFKRAQ